MKRIMTDIKEKLKDEPGMLIYSKYNWGDVVYLKSDPDQKEHHIKGMCLRPGGEITYELGADWYYEFEFTTEKKY